MNYNLGNSHLLIKHFLNSPGARNGTAPPAPACASASSRRHPPRRRRPWWPSASTAQRRRGASATPSSLDDSRSHASRGGIRSEKPPVPKGNDSEIPEKQNLKARRTLLPSQITPEKGSSFYDGPKVTFKPRTADLAKSPLES